jgi:hypothetical protein
MTVRWGKPTPLIAVVYCTHTPDTPTPTRRCPFCGATIGVTDADQHTPPTTEARAQ